MRYNAIFWALILIFVGFVLLLGNLGIISVSWTVIWPLLLIAFGGWLIWGTLIAPRRPVEMEDANIPLEGATRANVRIEHGAGILRLTDGAPDDMLMTGSFAGGLDYRTDRNGDTLAVKMGVPGGNWFVGPWNWRSGYEWDVQFNEQTPMRLRVDAGASRTELDLTDLLIAELSLHTGASDTRITLPAHAGLTTAKIEAGAASVDIHVPGGVAARIRTESGLATIDIDPTRFPRSGNTYQSPDYETAENKIEMKINTGVGAVHVR
jgi:hypothetical protein